MGRSLGSLPVDDQRFIIFSRLFQQAREQKTRFGGSPVIREQLDQATQVLRGGVAISPFPMAPRQPGKGPCRTRFIDRMHGAVEAEAQIEDIRVRNVESDLDERFAIQRSPSVYQL